MQVFQRIAHDLMARVVGPLHFRLLLQPAMATFFGIRDGRQDARNHNPLYHLVALNWIYPSEAILVDLTLAFFCPTC
jgi:hypothetical protein